jgi:hypothetical protein
VKWNQSFNRSKAFSLLLNMVKGAFLVAQSNSNGQRTFGFTSNDFATLNLFEVMPSPMRSNVG